jgi:hypothetical protein
MSLLVRDYFVQSLLSDGSLSGNKDFKSKKQYYLSSNRLRIWLDTIYRK